MKLLKNTLTVALLTGLSVVASAATYEIDPHHAHVRFSVDHFGTSTNAGGFYNLSGVVEYEPEAQKGFVGITIPMGSLSTGIKAFDNHLKSADFFNVEQYPTAYFQSTNWQFNGDKVAAVTGNLTLLDQTHPVTLTATKFNCYDNPMLKTQVCGGDFETTIDRTKWGIDTLTDGGMMKDIKLKIQIEAGKK
ncbi:YceI family protein [Psychrobacter lutiphocae]|uniref:YceI family protein n=1 Tax=Psychrobacter lutiphocae TaxID=540500 RepID=UPI000380EF52|nr:YceI family protein [Psychrobacter lutiphocae]